MYATVNAQYKGGNGDGAVTKIMLSLNPLNNIYAGTFNDGFASAKIMGINPMPNIYAGKNGDGFGYALSQLQNFQANIYAGGTGDGSNYLAVLQENKLQNIYAGGNNDGYATVYIQNENSSLNIYNGGNSDGFATSMLLLQNPFANIYKGGNDDGFAGIVVYQLNNTASKSSLSFSGIWQQENIALNWNIIDQLPNSMYQLERSTGDASHFIKLTTGSKAKQRSGYGFIDADTRNASVFFYRLKRIDAGHANEYSAIVRLSKEVKNVSYTIYPNPGKGLFNITINGVEKPQGFSYNVLNATGTVIKKGNITSATTQFNISHMAAGLYYVQLFKNTQLQNTYKIILQH